MMKPITPEELADAGLAMFGSTWQTDLARSLTVNDRTLRRWLAGEVKMPDNLRAELIRWMEIRTDQIAGARKRLAG